MPTTSVNGRGIGGIFMDALTGGKIHKVEADAYAVRQRLDNDRKLKEAQATKALAEQSQISAAGDWENKQRQAAQSYAGSLGDYFVDRHQEQQPLVPLQGDFQGPPSRKLVPDSTNAMFRDMATNYAYSNPGANPEQIAGGNRETLGTFDMLFGNDPDRQRIGAAAAMDKYQGADDILLPGDREAVQQNEIEQIQTRQQAKAQSEAAADGSDAGAGSPYGGTGASNTNMRIIGGAMNLLDAGQALPAPMANNLALALNREYGPKQEVRIENGQKVLVTVQPPVPPRVAELMQMLRGGPATSNEGAVDTGVGVGSQSSSTAAPTPTITPPALPGNVQQSGAMTVETFGEKTPDALTEAQAKDPLFASTMNKAHDALSGYDEVPLGFMQGPVLRGDMGGDNPGLFDIASQQAAKGFASDDTKTFMVHVENFINPVLRKDSGAAVPVSEYPKYIARFIPDYGDGPDQIALKTQYRQQYMNELNNQIALVAAAKGTAEYNQQVGQIYQAMDQKYLTADPQAPVQGTTAETPTDIDALLDQYAPVLTPPTGN